MHPSTAHPCTTYAPRIGGQRVFVLLTHDRANGRLSDVRVCVHKLGSDFRGAIDLVMQLASWALERGESPAAVADRLEGAAIGGPGGKVEGLDGATELPNVAALVAAVLRLDAAGGGA